MKTITTINDPWTDDEVIGVDDFGNQEPQPTRAQALEAHASGPFNDWMADAKRKWETETLPAAIAAGMIVDRGPDFLADGHVARYCYA